MTGASTTALLGVPTEPPSAVMCNAVAAPSAPMDDASAIVPRVQLGTVTGMIQVRSAPYAFITDLPHTIASAALSEPLKR